jgi:hypothetical protein
VLLAGGLALGLLASSDPRQPPGSPPPKPAGKVFVPDPKAPAVAEKLKGTWVGSITSPDGTTTRHVKLRFVDGSHLVETVTQVSPGVRGGAIVRYRYELKNGELKLEMLEKYNGDEQSNEPVPLRETDKKPREFTFKWVTEGGKVGFRRVSKADPDSPWAAVTFVRADDTPAADPPVPEALRNLDRAIRKEPKYAGTPLYLLLAFGPEARFKVWVVLDTDTLYVDRNGNGDLTEEGEQVGLGSVPGVEPNPRAPAFLVGDLTDTAGAAKHTDFFFSAIRMSTGSVFTKLGLRVNGKTLQMAGPTDLRIVESPNEARVVHFGGKVVTAVPSYTMRSTPDAGTPTDFRVQVGTPGVGPGSFASFGNDGLADEVAPVAEFEFAPAAGGAPQRVVLPLTERCCGDQFFAKLTVPDGVKAGVGAAKVTLTFPGCPWGKVEPATYPVDVIPKPK